MTYLPRSTGNAAGNVAVVHVVNVTQKLQFVIHSRDDSVQTVSNESNLFVELCITSQGVNSDIGELSKEFLDAGSILEEPF